MSLALRMISEALGVPAASPHDCPMCGPASPFGLGAKLGANFCDLDLLHGEGVSCAGCTRIMGGRPGDTPPPLRTVSFVARGPHLVVLDRPSLWRELWDPTCSDRRVVSWGASRKKHHALRAGISQGDSLLVGADSGAIRIDRQSDRALADAVVELLGSPTGVSPILSRESIRSGDYHPASIQRYGVDQWRRLEAVVSTYRPSGLLDLVCYCAPLGPPPQGESALIDPYDDKAAWLLQQLATVSQMRREHGQSFWGGFFRHRLERCRRMSLPDLVSKLTDALQCDVTQPQYRAATSWLVSSSEDESRDVSAAIKARPGYLVALAYDRVRTSREAAKAAKENA